MARKLAFFSLVLVLLLGAASDPASGYGILKVRNWAGGGAEILSLSEDSPVAKAGIKPGDVILQAGGNTIRNTQDLIDIIRQFPTNQSMILVVSRDGWEKTVRLPPWNDVAPKLPAAPWFGISLSQQPAQEPPGHGALITGVDQGGPAYNAGLRKGDVITFAEGRKIFTPAEFEGISRTLPTGGSISINVTRDGWEKEIMLQSENRPPTNIPPEIRPELSTRQPQASQEMRQEPEVSARPGTDPAAVPQQYREIETSSPAIIPQEPPAQGRQESPKPVAGLSLSQATTPQSALKAALTVGDFQVKAANATSAIGDGLREMFLTALHGMGRFIVVERIDLRGLAAEQALSRSSMARNDMAIPAGRMDVADLMVYGAVTEFEIEAGGTGFGIGVPVKGIPLSLGRSSRESHIAIDIRVVDVATGRLIITRRITGSATGSSTSLQLSPQVKNMTLPIGIENFKNTPMEEAIRSCIQEAAQAICNNLPMSYYRYRE